MRSGRCRCSRRPGRDMRSGRSRCSRRPGRGRSTYVRYEHTDFFSTDEASDFVENEVRVGMTFRR